MQIQSYKNYNYAMQRDYYHDMKKLLSKSSSNAWQKAKNLICLLDFFFKFESTRSLFDLWEQNMQNQKFTTDVA